ETRRAVVRELHLRGYETAEAGDASGALRRWEQRRAGLGLLNLGLADKGGLQVIRRIRREATTPIVILSGRYDERAKVQALEAGAPDYVKNPFGVHEPNAQPRGP